MWPFSCHKPLFWTTTKTSTSFMEKFSGGEKILQPLSVMAVEDFVDSEFNSCDGGLVVRWNNSSQFDLIEAYWTVSFDLGFTWSFYYVFNLFLVNQLKIFQISESEILFCCMCGLVLGETLTQMFGIFFSLCSFHYTFQSTLSLD